MLSAFLNVVPSIVNKQVHEVDDAEGTKEGVRITGNILGLHTT